MNLLMKGAALAPPFSCTTKYSSDVYSPRPPDIRVRLLPTKPPVHFTTEQPGRDNKLLQQRKNPRENKMDASYKIQRGIHVHLIQFFMCPEFWVHIIRLLLFYFLSILCAAPWKTMHFPFTGPWPHAGPPLYPSAPMQRPAPHVPYGRRPQADGK